MSKIDARMISLFSRDARMDPCPKHLEEETSGYSFSFYDAIDVRKAETGNGPAHEALLSAYERSLDFSGSSGFSYRQVLFAFRDLTDAEADADSPQSIDRFWDGSEEPLLFVSMINVTATAKIPDTLDRIEALFGTERCRPYLTFDHCDIIIFFKGHSFSDFTDRIFELNYGLGLAEDTITLFTFLNERRFPREKYAALSGEDFGVNIRVGVRDFPGFERFKEKLDLLDRQFSAPHVAFCRLLGRNDVAVWKRKANMAWLERLKDLVDSEPFWYTTYDMEVLIPCGQKSYAPLAPAGTSESELRHKMEECSREFEQTYREKCKEMKTSADEVFLRWLRGTSALSVSFFENLLSADLGTCLVPQFFDILEYGRRFFSSEKAERGHMDNVREVFREFFSNISILTDSLNHSNRQFVQIPSYNSISFEMPPKIMAYFSVLAKNLAEVFQDEKGLLYGVTISPKFACELDVSSLAVRRVLEKDELIAISIEERSLYSLLLTTEAMAHEISHFVGEGNRCRERRREFFMKCAAAELLDDLFAAIQDELSAGERLTMDWDSAQELVNRLWECLDRLPAYGIPGRIHYLQEVYQDCLNLPAAIVEHPTLRYELFQWLRKTLCVEGPLLKHLIQINAKELGLPELAEGQSWTIDRLKEDGLWEYCRALAEDEIYRTMCSLLKDGARKNKEMEQPPYVPLFFGAATSENYNITAHISYMFGETFADLQTILLFDMDLEDYYRLLMDGRQDKPYDALPRMTAVARALLRKGWWNEEKIALRDDGNVADVLCRAARLAEDQIVLLQNDGISPNLVYYLTGYLSECVDAVQKTLEEHSALRDRLRCVHKSLKKEDSISGLSGEMLRLIDEYRVRLSGS